VGIGGYSLTLQDGEPNLGQIMLWPSEEVGVRVFGRLLSQADVLVVMDVTFPPGLGSFGVITSREYRFELQLPGFLIFKARILIFCLAGDLVDSSPELSLTEMTSMAATWDSGKDNSCCTLGNANLVKVAEECVGKVIQDVRPSGTEEAKCCRPGCGFGYGGTGLYKAPCRQGADLGLGQGG
jgi:hypothetical protein